MTTIKIKHGTVPHLGTSNLFLMNCSELEMGLEENHLAVAWRSLGLPNHDVCMMMYGFISVLQDYPVQDYHLPAPHKIFWYKLTLFLCRSLAIGRNGWRKD